MTLNLNWQAIALTAKLATVVCILLMLIALPLAYWLAYSKHKWKFMLEAVVALPLVLPPTVLGFYVLVALGSRSPLGLWFKRLTGHSFAFSFQGLVIASILYSLPFAVQPIATAFAAVDSRLLAAASVLGSSPLERFRRVVLPLSFSGLITGAVLSFAHTVGEFGVVLMVGGNIPGVTRTVSIDIYDRVQELDYAGANSTALLLLVFSFALLAVVYGVNRYRRGWLGR